MLCGLCLEREAIDAEGLCQECIDAEVEAGNKRAIVRVEQARNAPAPVAPKKPIIKWGEGNV